MCGVESHLSCASLALETLIIEYKECLPIVDGDQDVESLKSLLQPLHTGKFQKFLLGVTKENLAKRIVYLQQFSKAINIYFSGFLSRVRKLSEGFGENRGCSRSGIFNGNKFDIEQNLDCYIDRYIDGIYAAIAFATMSVE